MTNTVRRYRGYDLRQQGDRWVIVYEYAPPGESGDIVSRPWSSFLALKNDIDRRIGEQQAEMVRDACRIVESERKP